LISARGLLPLRFLGFWLGTGAAALAIGLALSLAPIDAPLPIVGEDKTLHFAGFLFLTIWFAGMVESRLLWQVATLLAVYGVLIELLQGLTADRAAEPYDVLANLAGIGSGWLLSVAGLRHWCRRVEGLLGAGTS
jgi:hypothetical protein